MILKPSSKVDFFPSFIIVAKSRLSTFKSLSGNSLSNLLIYSSLGKLVLFIVEYVPYVSDVVLFIPIMR